MKAAIGASTMSSSPAIAPNGPESRLSSRPPPKIAPNIAMRASNMIAVAIDAATAPIRMSRLCTCDNSCASTPSSSRSSTTFKIPCVTATAA